MSNGQDCLSIVEEAQRLPLAVAVLVVIMGHHVCPQTEIPITFKVTTASIMFPCDIVLVHDIIFLVSSFDSTIL
jgi:hypothetical protein